MNFVGLMMLSQFSNIIFLCSVS